MNLVEVQKVRGLSWQLSRKESTCNAGDAGSMQEMREGSLEEGMATHSSTLARKIPWTEEPDRAAKSQTRLK